MRPEKMRQRLRVMGHEAGGEGESNCGDEHHMGEAEDVPEQRCTVDEKAQPEDLGHREHHRADDELPVGAGPNEEPSTQDATRVRRRSHAHCGG